MADEGMDPCECIWSQEMVMRRLLSFLRQSQSHCTDTECLDELPSLPGQQTGDSSGAMLMMMVWFAVALGLFLLRPGPLRNNPDTKPTDNNNGPGSSGSPPPMAN